jgi:hypothetical protein
MPLGRRRRPSCKYPQADHCEGHTAGEGEDLAGEAGDHLEC